MGVEMKRMQDKEGMTWLSWAIVAGIACWGGLVRYVIDLKQSKATWSWVNAILQVVVSGFTGIIGGLVSVESSLSLHMVFAVAGISGSMGSIALTFFWERITGVKNNAGQ